MSRRRPEFVDISDYTSLDDLIQTLKTLRARLPHNAEPELKMRGDDFFGRKLTIRFLRELTAEEALIEARYSNGIVAATSPKPRLRARRAA